MSARTGDVRRRGGVAWRFGCARRRAQPAARRLLQRQAADARPTRRLPAAGEAAPAHRLRAARASAHPGRLWRRLSRPRACRTMLEKTVDKLVAASERPELKYEVTILNSPAVNAFALPNGQLYVTRGLIALANDNSELASVMAHEMAHVIARHAEIREDQARQAALVNRVATDVLSDPQLGALALAKIARSRSRTSRAPRSSRPTASASASPRAPASIPTAPSASSPRWGRTRICGRSAPASTRARRTSCRRIRRRRSASTTRIANARQFTGPGRRRARPGRAISSLLDGLVYGEDPSEGFVRGRQLPASQARLHLHRAGRLHRSTTPRRRCSASRTTAPRRCASTSCGCRREQTLPEYLNSGWIENIDLKSIEEMTVGGFPAATATASGDQWTFRLYVVRFGSEVYRVIYAAKNRTEAVDKSFRESLSTFRRMSTAEIAVGAAAQAQGGAGQARRHGREVRPPHGGGRPRGRAVPRAQRARREGARQGRRYGQGGGGVARVQGAQPARSARRPANVPVCGILDKIILFPHVFVATTERGDCSSFRPGRFSQSCAGSQRRCY